MSVKIAGMSNHKTMEFCPLVSIGIPTYNWPEGLMRTLNCICEKTYNNIEIIISDNYSPDSEAKNIAEEYARRDRRVTYFRQEKSLVADGNFKFVLKKGKGDYFMWAADDDEWSTDFIEQCLEVLLEDDVVSVMSNFETYYRYDGRKEAARMYILYYDIVYAIDKSDDIGKNVFA